MSKVRNTARTLQSLSSYKFDTSKYLVLKDGIKRDARSGSFVAIKAASVSKSGSSSISAKKKK